MRALVLAEYGRLEVRGVDAPVVGAGDVLVRVAACGICGSDVHGLDGSTGRRRPPVVMGHEAAGVVAAVGGGVTRWRVGDRVTFDSTVYCGRCDFCRRGRINLCDARRVLGVSCGEYRCDGAFAEYVAVPEGIVYGVPDSLSLEHAAMVEPVSVAVHAVARTRVAVGDMAVVVGVGMIGLLVVQVLGTTGCAGVIAVDVEPARLDRARALGACVGIDASRGDAAAAVMEHTGGRGADVVFDVAGTEESVGVAVGCARKGGTVTLVGNVAPEVPLPLQAVVTRELSLLGSCASCGEYPVCLDLMASGKVDVGPLISAVAPLEEGHDWFQRLYAKEPGLMKVLLRP